MCNQLHNFKGIVEEHFLSNIEIDKGTIAN
jgi:hypothetical protein